MQYVTQNKYNNLFGKSERYLPKDYVIVWVYFLSKQYNNKHYIQYIHQCHRH